MTMTKKIGWYPWQNGIAVDDFGLHLGRGDASNRP